MDTINLRFRTWSKGLPPQSIKLEIPGWSGQKNYQDSQPWHCKPFIDGATYGLEILYPYDTQVTVRADKEGVSSFECDSESEWDKIPFGNFAPHYFGFTSSIDIQTDSNFGIMILPHPRFYTDIEGTVPLPSTGFIESDWWPKIFFIPFKAPFPHQKYIFKKGDGIAQILVLPKSINYNISRMSVDEEKIRAKYEHIIFNHPEIATKKWRDQKGNAFENKYKILSQIEKKEQGSVVKWLESLAEKDKLNKSNAEEYRRDKIKRKLIKPEIMNGNKAKR